MKDLKKFNAFIWGLAGVTNLMSDKISKLSYALIWVALMMFLIKECVD